MKIQFFLAVVLICLPSIAVAQAFERGYSAVPLAQATAPQGGNANEGVNQGAKSFMDQYWSKVSAPNAVALPYIGSAVANQVNFYGQVLSRAKLLKTEAAFLNRWPNRQYEVQADTINCDESTSTCEATGSISLNATSPDRGATTQAGDDFDFTLSYQTVDGKVVFHIVKITSSGDGAGQVTYLTTGWEPTVSVELPDSKVQEIGCPDYSWPAFKKIEVHENCTAIATADLTGTYQTTAKWQFVVTQENRPDDPSGPENLQFAFLKNGALVNTPGSSAKFAGEYSPTQYCANSAADVNLVFPTKNTHRPIIVVTAQCFIGGPNEPDFMGIWAYNPSSQQFEMIWGSVVQCGEDARLFTTGSLAGYVVAYTDPPMNKNGQMPPYNIISVYRLMADQSFYRVLYYRHYFKPTVSTFDTCGYFDPYAGVDSEVPTILARLGLTHH